MTCTVIVKVPEGANYRAELETHDPFSINSESHFMYVEPGNELHTTVYGTREVTVREVSLKPA